MTKRERIMAAVSGQQPDTLPYSFWTHLPGIDLDPEKLAEATYDFYRTYDVDFIKTMNNGMYPVEDFGAVADYSEIVTGGVAKVVQTPIQTPEDWYKLSPVSVHEGSYARELKSLRLLLEKVKGEDVPVVFTIFTPITIANKLSMGKVRQHINEGHGEAIHHALKAIAGTTAALAKEAIALGADGVFMASQSSTYDFMTAEEYREYGVPYDVQVLQAASDGWMNTIHAHGNNIMFEVLRDYPVQVFNWHVWETKPDLDECQVLTGKCMMGGLNRNYITNRDFNGIQNNIYQCLRLLDGCHQILTPGCVIRYPLDDKTLAYVKQCKDFVESKLKD